MTIEVKPDGWSWEEWNMLSHGEKEDFIGIDTGLIDGKRSVLKVYREIAAMRLELGGPVREEDLS